MFLSAKENPTKIKHVLYLALCTLIGLLIALLVTTVISLSRFYSDNDQFVSPVLQWGVNACGAIGGFFLGKF
jgi:hypothetical protein